MLIRGSLPDLNQDPFSSISVSSGEDYASDSSDSGKTLSKRGKSLLSDEIGRAHV